MSLDDADILRIPAGPASLHVERYGLGGRPVVLLHGFGTTSFLWREVGARLAVAGWSVHAIDLMGHGESDRPFGAGLGIADQAEYLDRALTVLRIASATIVGVDLGAAVALRLAADWPERVDRLVLVNPIGPGAVPAEDVRGIQRNTARFALRITRGVLAATSLVRPLLLGSVADERHMPPRLQARYLAPFAGRDGVAHLLTLARAVRADDMDELDLATIAAPTLVVRGDADQWVHAEVAEAIAREMPNGRLVRLRRVGRLVPEEAPGTLTELVLRELTGTGDPGADVAIAVAEDEPAPAAAAGTPSGHGV